MHKNRPVSFELLYALGDSFTDFDNYVPLTTPPGNLNNFLFDFGYALSTTNQPFIDGVSYIQTAVNEFGVADEVVNVAIRGARAIGSRTIESSLLADRLPEPGAPSLFDIIGNELTEAQLSADINLSAQTERVIDDFIMRGRPKNTAASLLIGANDLNGILLDIGEALESSETNTGGIIDLLHNAVEALRPKNTGASLLSGANDLNGILLDIIGEALESSDTNTGGIIYLLLDAVEALVRIVGSITSNTR